MLACPWCGESNQLSLARELASYWIQCPCGAAGPRASNDDPEDGREAAEDLWDIRGEPRATIEAIRKRARHEKYLRRGYGAKPVVKPLLVEVDENYSPPDKSQSVLRPKTIYTDRDLDDLVMACAGSLRGDPKALAKEMKRQRDYDKAFDKPDDQVTLAA
jgi:hypothetical protein